jgi:hypothetical protein
VYRFFLHDLQMNGCYFTFAAAAMLTTDHRKLRKSAATLTTDHRKLRKSAATLTTDHRKLRQFATTLTTGHSLKNRPYTPEKAMGCSCFGSRIEIPRAAMSAKVRITFSDLKNESTKIRVING